MKTAKSGILQALVVLIVLGATFALWYFWPDIMEKRPWPAELPLEGGRNFKSEVLIPAPFFSQADPRWALQPLANTPATLAQEGCAVAAAAMALAYHGADTDPGRLNALLTAHPGGYTERGWIYWEAAALVSGADVRAVYQGPPDFHRLDRELSRGNPVIIRLRLPNGMMHFVLAVGKRGLDYLVWDPMLLQQSEPIPLREVGGVMTGMRIYLKRKPLWARQFILEVPRKQVPISR